MDIDKTIAALRNWDGIKPERMMAEAVTALTMMQVENAQLRAQLHTEEQAVQFAALVLAFAGACPYKSEDGCRRKHRGSFLCVEHIRSWLLSEARKGLQTE